MEPRPAAQRRGEEGSPVVGSGVRPPPAPHGPKPWPRHLPAGRGAFRSHPAAGEPGAPPALLRLRRGGCACGAPGAPAGTHCNLPRGRQGALSRSAALAPRGRRRGRGCDASSGRRGDGATGSAAGGREGGGGAAGAMGNLFGRKKQSRVTEQDRAVLVRRARGPGRPGRGLGARSPVPESTLAGRLPSRVRGRRAGTRAEPSGRPGLRPRGPRSGAEAGARPQRWDASGSRGPAAPAGICFRGLPLPWGRRCAPASGALGVGVFPWEEETLGRRPALFQVSCRKDVVLSREK